MAIWLQGGDVTIIPGYTALDKNEEILKCVYRIADLVSNMTIMLMENREDGDIRIKDELAKKIDVNPCKLMTRKTFIHRIVTDMCLYGNAVILPETDSTYIANLWIVSRDDYIFNFGRREYSISVSGKAFAPDEVIHIPLNPDTTYPYYGVGLAPMIKSTLQTLAQANATKTGFLQSKWKPSLIISANTDAEELMDANARSKILESYTKTNEAGEPWLIPAGEIDVKTIQPLTLQDLAIQDSITLDLKTVARCFGIPPFLVGIGDFSKDEYNNFVSTTIMSIATAIQQELTKKLLLSPQRYFKFNPKSLMQYNLAEKVEFVKEMTAGGMLSRNEGRNEFDYSPVDVDGMNDYNVLENYIPVADVGKQKKLIQEGGGADE